MTKIYGLIGENLSHSFSPFIHNRFANVCLKCDPETNSYNYQKYEVSESDLQSFFKNPDFCGVNVTIPYKKIAMKYCDEISDIAREIGCINIIYKKNDKFYGDNFDYYGLQKAIKIQNIDIRGKKTAILGTGATSLTAAFLCKNSGATEILKFSRTGAFNYQNIYNHDNIEVIINTTPSGMYPKNGKALIDLSCFYKLYAVVDVVANPFKTRLLLQAEELGLKFINGISMMVFQAKKSAEVLLNQKITDVMAKETTDALIQLKQNIILIGMPGCGKSTIGKILEKKLSGKTLIDIDDEIEKHEKKSIEEIFNKNGEQYFRQLENKYIEKFTKEHSLIISTGGGAVLDRENILNIKQNGIVFYINRNLENLTKEKRPLSKNLESLLKIYEQRRELYEQCADVIIDNNSDILHAITEITKKLRRFN